MNNNKKIKVYYARQEDGKARFTFDVNDAQGVSGFFFGSEGKVWYRARDNTPQPTWLWVANNRPSAS